MSAKLICWPSFCARVRVGPDRFRLWRRACLKSGEGFPEVPGHPALGGGLHPGAVSLDRDKVVEGVHALQFACVNEGHEEVADPGSVLALVEECIFAVEDCPLQGSLDDVMPRPGLCRISLVFTRPGAEVCAIARVGHAA